MKHFLKRLMCFAIGSSKLWKCAYEVLLASVRTLVLRCFVCYQIFVCGKAEDDVYITVRCVESSARGMEDIIRDRVAFVNKYFELRIWVITYLYLQFIKRASRWREWI